MMKPRSQTLRFVNGYAILTDDATSSKQKMISPHQQNETEEILVENKEKATCSFVPAYVALDRIVLRFFAKYTEIVHDSATETSRERRVVFRVYAEDLTIDATEPKQENSGLQQGLYLKRTKCEEVFSERLREALVVKSNEIGGGDTAAEVKRVVLEMLKVGNTITVCGRAFSVYACDGFTRQFYEEGEEMSMPPNETNEHESSSSRDSKDDFESGVNNSLAFKHAKGPPNARLDDMARFSGDRARRWVRTPERNFSNTTGRFYGFTPHGKERKTREKTRLMTRSECFACTIFSRTIRWKLSRKADARF